MEKILQVGHNEQTALYAFSKLFERMSYYGVRSLIILYMVDGPINMDIQNAATIYSYLIASAVVFYLLGGLLGDLVLGNKRAIIIGGVLQIVGILVLTVPTEIGLYAGIGLLLFGNGLYTPNVAAQYGKNYLHKLKSLDAGFAIYFSAINIGGFIGPLVLGAFSQSNSFREAFIIAAVIMAISTLFAFFTNDKEDVRSSPEPDQNNNSVLYILIALFTGGLFWGVYEVCGLRTMDLQASFIRLLSLQDFAGVLISIQSSFVLLISVFAAILWSFIYTHHLVKMSIGLVVATSAYLLVFTIPEIPDTDHILTFSLFMLFITIGEVFVDAPILSMITRYANGNYLAIFHALYSMVVKIFSFAASFGVTIYHDQSTLLLKAGIGVILLLTTVVIAMMLKYKRNTPYID